MKKITLSIIVLLYSAIAYTQAEASNWYFGSNAGIQFNANGTTTNLTDGRLNTDEGCTTISDSSGNLLFYTDGITIWNKLHQPMPNANGAIGNGLFGDPSSTQSAIVVPKPEDPNIYYIFTVDTSIGGDPDRGFNYSTVDLRLDGGLGDVVASSKNENLLQDSSEKISAVLKDCVSKSIWVITFASVNGIPGQPFNTFHAYEVSTSGVNTSPVSSSFNITIGDARGYLKLSPDGTKLACANSTSGLYLYDFDAATGTVTNQNSIDIDFAPGRRILSAYGVEFSQNSKILYVSSYFQTDNDNFGNPSSQYGALLQYDLNASNIESSEIVIDDRQMFRGALQLGPNGKIYRAMSVTYPIGSPYLSVINNPNELGLKCNYQHNAVRLSRNSRQGLPPFIASFFAENINITQKESNITYLPLCIGEPYTLMADDIPGATYTWLLNDIVQSDSDFDFDISIAGEYKLIIQTVDGDCGDVFEGTAFVSFFDSPIVNAINDILICDTDNDNAFIFDLSTLNSEILATQDPLIYSVKYFDSQINADLNRNELPNIIDISKMPQTIYTRIGLFDNTTCFDTSMSFNIQLFDTPIANAITSSKFCDNQTSTDSNVTNGLTDIDLTQFDSDILGNQDSSNFTITYHATITDAESKNNLNYTYTNSTPFEETIFARIENNLNTECYSISAPIVLTIYPLPEFSNTTLIQCDVDGTVDEITLFNLNESIDVLTNAELNRTVKFYKSINDAENSLNEILNQTNFPNTINPQTIYAQIINDDTECFDIAELTLEVSTTKIDDYSAPPLCDELNSEDGLNTFDLDAFTGDMQSINGITLPMSYYETYEDALSEENELNVSYNNTVPYSQTIYARAENDNACYGISKVFLTVHKLPNIQTEDLTYYCLNKFPEPVTLSAAILEGAPLDYSYNWSNGDSTFETEITSPGTYTVEVTNTNNCSKVRTIVVEPYLATFNSPPYKVVDGVPNNSVTVFASIQGLYEYALYNNNNNIIYRDFQTSNIFENVFPGIYTIRIRDVNDDCGTIFEKVSVIGFPKFFTPNSDGKHDTWQVYGVSNMFQENSKILIYNRFGKLVKQLDPKGMGWNGIFNGQLMPSDDYWFAVTLQDGRVFKSHFTLKR